MSDLRTVPLSVLDLAPIPAGGTAAGALRATIELAKRAEELGYQRFWVAEHHNMPGIASSAPPVLIGHLADATSRIHVGSGGVMLPNHVSLVVAEQFGMLEALHPGRIDLGIGRAPGTDPATAAALRRSPEGLSPDEFPEQLTDLIGFFSGEWPDGHPYASITAVPGQGDSPALWLLGSSGYSAQVAGLLGLPFAFAHHFSSVNTLPALALYRQQFRPSETLAQPHAMIAANVICAETDERAQYLAGPERPVVSAAADRTSRPAPVAGRGRRLPVHRAGPRDHRVAPVLGHRRQPGHGPPRPGRVARGDRRRRADGDRAAVRPGRPGPVAGAGGRDRRPGQGGRASLLLRACRPPGWRRGGYRWILAPVAVM